MEKDLEREVREHLLSCMTCAIRVGLPYGAEMQQAMRGGALPDELASKIRAKCCKRGAEILDRVVGVRA
jgi:hypothetical protein